MQDDETRTCALLRTTSEAIARCPVEDKYRLSANLVRLGRTLRDNPLVSGALEELAWHDAADEAALATRVESLEEIGRRHARCFASLLGRMTDATKEALFSNSHLNSGSEPREFRDLLKEIKLGHVSGLTLRQMEKYRRNILPHLRESLASLQDSDPAVDALFAEVQLLETNGTASSHILETTRVVAKLGTRGIAHRLLGFLNTIETRLAAGVSKQELKPDDLQHDAIQLIELITLQIQEGAARLYALHRLRVLFEHFLRATLRAELEQEECHNKPQRERIIQRHMDEFLFREGYFPLTHSAASDGYMDTMLLESADSTRIPPLLIELKQAISIDEPGSIHVSHVEKAIRNARAEVQRYRGHLSARTQWRGVVPLLVVVHTCRTDVSHLGLPDVVLIDISDRKPSGKRASLVE